MVSALPQSGTSCDTGTVIEAIVAAASKSIELGHTDCLRLQRYLRGALNHPGIAIVLLLDAFDEVGSLPIRKELFNQIQADMRGNQDVPIKRAIVSSRGNLQIVGDRFKGRCNTSLATTL